MILDNLANLMIKYHEPRIKNNINEIIQILNKNKISVIFDIGSNIGSFTKLISKEINYNQIHLFEASTEIYNYSLYYLKDIKNIFINNNAISNNNKTKILYKCPKNIKNGKLIIDNKVVLRVCGCKGDSNIGWNTMLEDGDPGQTNTIGGEKFFYQFMDKEEVTCITLDEYVEKNNINTINLIKIDIEGFEGFALEGSLKSIKKFKPLLYIEIGWGKKHPKWDYNKLIYKKILDMGYITINCNNLLENGASGDIIFLYKQ